MVILLARQYVDREEEPQRQGAPDQHGADRDQDHRGAKAPDQGAEQSEDARGDPGQGEDGWDVVGHVKYGKNFSWASTDANIHQRSAKQDLYDPDDDQNDRDYYDDVFDARIYREECGDQPQDEPDYY
jgi:hypothetical protein